MAKLVLSIGGSNSIGRGPGGPAMNSASSLVTVWNNVQEAGTNGTAWISPPVAGNAPWDPSGALGNNFALWFCHRLALETGETVRLLLVGRGNASDVEFTKGGALYTELADVWTAAAPGVPADILLTGIVTTANESLYPTKYLQMRTDMIADGYLRSGAPSIVCGAVVTDDTFLSNMAAANPSIMRFAPVTTLNIMPDGDHFTGPSLYQWGYDVMWRAYSGFIGPRTIAGNALRFIKR